MVTRAVVDGLPNEPIAASTVERLTAGILGLLDVDGKDVQSLTITARKIRAKVAVRNKRGRRLPGMWAHVEVSILEDDVEGES